VRGVRVQSAALRASPLTREALVASGGAAILSALLLWAGPSGSDFAAHVYQRAIFIQHGFALWNNFWYAGRYSFISARIQDILGYHPEQLVGKKLADVQQTSAELITLYQSVASGEKQLAAAEYTAQHVDGTWRTMRGTALHRPLRIFARKKSVNQS